MSLEYRLYHSGVYIGGLTYSCRPPYLMAKKDNRTDGALLGPCGKTSRAVQSDWLLENRQLFQPPTKAVNGSFPKYRPQYTPLKTRILIMGTPRKYPEPDRVLDTLSLGFPLLCAQAQGPRTPLQKAYRICEEGNEPQQISHTGGYCTHCLILYQALSTKSAVQPC